MKFKSLVYLSILLSGTVFGQETDTISEGAARVESSFYPRTSAPGHVLDFPREKRFFSSGNVTLATFNFPYTDIEKQIVQMENLEINALMNRDTAALRLLWLRDFTLDAPQNDLLRGSNPIPYYVKLSRFVEKLTVLGDMVITSGTEFFILLNSNGKVEERKERTYTHSWTRNNFSWKLTTKMHP